MVVCLSTIQPLQAANSSAAAEHLRCEYGVDPLGIDVTQPRLCWEMHDSRRGAKQTAYQVLVASTPERLAAQAGDLWDSGRVAGDQSTQIVYAGNRHRVESPRRQANHGRDDSCQYHGHGTSADW